MTSEHNDGTLRVNRRQALGWGGALLGAGAMLGRPGSATATAHATSPAAAGAGVLGDAAPHPVLPDVSTAGHRGGETPPRRPVVARVTDFGARGDGTTDDAEAFETAVRA